jgi:hypothetical protein
MAATAGHRLTFDPMGKCSNAFFSETTNIIRAKLYMMYCGGGQLGFPIGIKNIQFVQDLPMIIPMQFGFNCPNFSLKPLGQLKPNCPGMIIGRSSTNFMFFMPIGNPRWPPPQYID